MYRLVHFNKKKLQKKCTNLNNKKNYRKYNNVIIIGFEHDTQMLRRVYMGLCTTAYLLVLFSFNVTSNAKRRLVLTLLHPIYMENKPTKLLTYYYYVWITLSHKSLYCPTSFTFRILNTEILFAILTFYQFTGII